jgi:hypothetical protein
VAVVLQSLFRVFVTCRAGRDQINCKTKFDVSPHTVDVISVNADFLCAPRGKRTPFHHQVNECEQIKTVFALTVDSAMSCMPKFS